MKPPPPVNVRHRTAYKMGQQIRETARSDMDSELANCQARYRIAPEKVAALRDALLDRRLDLLCRQLEAEALGSRRAVAWDREAASNHLPIPPADLMTLEKMKDVKTWRDYFGPASSQARIDWKARLASLSPKERDRLRVKAKRGVGLKRGRGTLRARGLVLQYEDAIRAAGGKLSGGNCNSPAWRLLFAALCWALPINTALRAKQHLPGILSFSLRVTSHIL